VSCFLEIERRAHFYNTDDRRASACFRRADPAAIPVRQSVMLARSPTLLQVLRNSTSASEPRSRRLAIFPHGSALSAALCRKIPKRTRVLPEIAQARKFLERTFSTCRYFVKYRQVENATEILRMCGLCRIIPLRRSADGQCRSRSHATLYYPRAERLGSAA
jgi:hypothetical protein